ncbi:MAG: LacI family transcriptional regulator [Spirochaetia bacterium]|jgi:LacI family transcriptional regulator|nr:LacI family transcriptional regulator [Spirochaetia bacterium]
MKKITIKDIAVEAGVSITTVSRVINGNYPVSDGVKDKVRRVMQEMDYHPNAIARSLRSNRTNLIALVIADLSNRFFMEIAKGLEYEISSLGYQLLIASSGGEPAKEKKIINALIEKQIDGLVVASSGGNTRELQKCLAFDIPLVLIDRPVEGIRTDQILWNDFEASYQLTDLLIKKGHRKIAIVNVTLSNPTGRNRLAAFKKALEDASVEIDDRYISASNFNRDEAYAFVYDLMSKPNPPTAFFCVNNIMLEGTLQALKDLGSRIYEDVSIVVFGDAECNRYISPKITVAYQDSLLMGRNAGILLSHRLEGKDGFSVSQLVLDAPIHEGGSVRSL